jgi:hypothetical protein
LTPTSRRAPLATAIVTALAAAALVVPLGGVGRAHAGHTGPYLDVNPETSRAALRASVKMSAALTNATGVRVNAGSDVVVNFEVDGPGDPGTGTGPDGRSFDSPDFRCTIHAGEDHCRKSYANRNNNPGEDTVWAWIGTTPDDPDEGQSVRTEPGAHVDGKPSDAPYDPATGTGTHQSPDATDVVSATWFDGLAGTATLDCTPEAATAAVGGSKTFTCAVRNAIVASGWQIDAENLSPGVNDPDNSAAGTKGADYDSKCVTGGDGRCTVTIPAERPAAAGRAVLCFWVDEEGDSSFHPGGRVEWDGSLCDQEAVGAPEGDNKTDLVGLTWRFARTISLRSSKRVVARGRSFVLTGSIASGAAACKRAQRVVVQRDAFNDGRTQYAAFRSTTTGARGGYSVTIQARVGARYRAVVAATSTCTAATSGSVTVRARG